jgi:hypothetical protein
MGFDLLEKRKNDMFRRSYPKLLLVFLFLSVIALMLTLTLVALAVRTPKPDNYAALSTGQVLPLYAYSAPVLSDSFIRSWAANAARAVLNLSFDDYENQLREASVYFQPSAFTLFREVLEKHGYLKSLRSAKLIMSGYVHGPIVIVWQGVEGRQFVWKVQLPMTVTYEGASALVNKSLVVRMVIARVPTADDPRAILIKSIHL